MNKIVQLMSNLYCKRPPTPKSLYPICTDIRVNETKGPVPISRLLTQALAHESETFECYAKFWCGHTTR